MNRTTNKRPQEQPPQKLMASGMVVVQWSSDIGPDAPLLYRWREFATFETDAVSIQRNDAVTELRGRAFYGPVSAQSVAELRQRFEQELANTCALVGATSFAVLHVQYRTEENPIFEDVPSWSRVSEELPGVLKMLSDKSDDINLPLTARKQLDAVRAHLRCTADAIAEEFHRLVSPEVRR